MTEENMSMNETKSKSPVIFITVSVFCLMVIGYFMFIPGGEDANKHLKVEKMQEMTAQVQGLETTVKKKEQEVQQLAGEYQTRTGKKALISLSKMNLTAEEKNLLEEQIENEKDVSIKSLLKNILNKKNEISVLRTRIAAIEDLLPMPHIAQKGESHYEIAMDFLVNEKGVEKEKAQKLLARTALFEELAEGFKIWNFYDGEEYGTSVGQGNAKVSPNAFIGRAKKKILAERDNALSERDQMAENVKSLEEKQNMVVTQLDQANCEKANLTARVSDLNKKVNSVFYRLDSSKNLKKSGVLKKKFLASTKMKDVSLDNFDKSLDLTVNDQVVISAEDIGVKKIKKVVLYPKFHKKGSSYKVLITKNKKYALLTLDKDKFKSERVVIAVN